MARKKYYTTISNSHWILFQLNVRDIQESLLKSTYLFLSLSLLSEEQKNHHSPSNLQHDHQGHPKCQWQERRMGEKKRKSLCLNGTFLEGVGEQKWQRRKKILVSFQRHIIQLPTVYICSTTKTQICASLVGVFFFFFFDGRERRRKKERKNSCYERSRG